MLAKKPQDRPQTANEVAKRLRTILEQTVAAPAAAAVPAAIPTASAADISTSMPVVVNPVPVQPPVVSAMHVSAQPESAFDNLDAKAEANNATHIDPTFDEEREPKPERKKAGGKGLLIAAGVAVLLAVVAVAAVFALKGKKGDPVVENKPPEGDKPAPKVAPGPLKPGPVGTDWVDLLALDQTWFEVPSGTWEKRDGKWTSAHLGGPRNLLGFPLTATGSYELEGELTLDKGSDSLAFMLPIGRQSVQFGFNLKSDPLPTIAGLHLVNGTPGHSQANPTLTAHDTFKVGERIKLAMSVRIKGDQVEFAATVGQIKPIRWTGPVVQLSRDTSLQIPNDRFGIEAFASQYTFHVLRFRKIDGEATILKPKTDAALLSATYKNSLGMEFVKVPKGTGWLGGGGGKPGETKVAFDQDFYLGKYEVTQGEWEKVTGQTPSLIKRGHEEVKDVPDADLKRFPVENVSWDECQVFIKKLNEREQESGWVYRLPKEAEWEYACRGGPVDPQTSAFDFYFAKPTNTLLPEQANFNSILKRTRKVGSYEPNSIGLYDMHGNVWERCDDAVTAADGASHRVIRGGDFYRGSGDCRATNHATDQPSARYPSVGLRVARVPVGTAPPKGDADRAAAEWCCPSAAGSRSPWTAGWPCQS